MEIVDLIAGALILAAAVWGFRLGLKRMLTPAAFVIGAVVGAAVVPRVLSDGPTSNFALTLALPAALIFGGLLAAFVERFATRRRRTRTHGPWVLGAIAGGLLAACCATALLWLLGAVVAQEDSVRNRLDDSTIIGTLNDVATPPGPAGAPEQRAFDPFPVIEGPRFPIAPVDKKVVGDPDVLKADRKVVRINVRSCGRRGIGSGWVAARGIVATNAHVTHAAESLRVRIQGKGLAYTATPIWWDPKNDISLLRVPGLDGVRPLQLLRRVKEGSPAVALGFPGGKRKVLPARIGETTDKYPGKMGEQGLPKSFPRDLLGRLITTMRADRRVQPGSSGGPVVDLKGRVLTTVFGGQTGQALGVPNRFVRRALRRAGPAVSTGECVSSR